MTKREKELEVFSYFMPSSLKHIEITEKDKEKYFEWSERGLHKEDVKVSHFNDGFNALVSAKAWAGRHMEIYEEGVLSGDMPYVVILEGTPRNVVDFMKKEMFKGIDAEIIEDLYVQSLS